MMFQKETKLVARAFSSLTCRTKWTTTSWFVYFVDVVQYVALYSKDHCQTSFRHILCRASKMTIVKVSRIFAAIYSEHTSPEKH